MNNEKNSSEFNVSILEEDTQLSLHDLCCACAVHAERIIELVEEGILEPTGIGVIEWRFTGINLVRARIAIRLQHDLSINIAGVALALDLLEEIDDLKKRHRDVHLNDG